MSVKKVVEIEFNLSNGSLWNGRRWGRLAYVLGEIEREILIAQSEGYEIADDWQPPPKFVIPMVENPEKVRLDELKVRARNLQRRIKEKEKEAEL